MTTHDEDQAFIRRHFVDLQNGRALVIGANEGFNNPSYSLIEKGWTAVCCEPNPFALSNFITNQAEYLEQITFVNCAITPTAGRVTPFYLAERNAMSSLDKDWLELQVERGVCPEDQAVQQEILTHTLSFQQLLNYVGVDFDLVVIDAEGQDSQLLGAIDWNQLHKCTMVCVEDIYDGAKWLEDVGFNLVLKSNHNYFYKRVLD
jgi:FkbM family methyltransferase